MANIQIKSMVLGMVGTNVFLVKNADTNELLIIDPADNAPIIEKEIAEWEGKPVAILLTHGLRQRPRVHSPGKAHRRHRRAH